jgi:signal transduction histidine kinase
MQAHVVEGVGQALEVIAGANRGANREIAALDLLGDFSEAAHRTQDELRNREKQALIAELAGAAAHELNQPLMIVGAYAQLLQRQVEADAEAKKTAEVITSEAQRMADIVRKVGSITKYETKSYVGEARILDLERASGTKDEPGERERALDRSIPKRPAPTRLTSSEHARSPAGTQKVHTARATGTDPWRDVLLALSLELPLDANPRELADRFLDGLVVLLPHLALGACVVTEPGEPPTLCVRLPPGASDAMERDPTRLFPLLREERVLPLDEASTFHVATNGPLAPLDLQITERSAQVLGKSLARSRAFRASERSSRPRAPEARMIQARSWPRSVRSWPASCELSNPLTSILAYATTWRSSTRSRDGQRVRAISAASSHQAASRILKFSRDLVAYSRPSTGCLGPSRSARSSARRSASASTIQEHRRERRPEDLPPSAASPARSFRFSSISSPTPRTP